MVILGGQILCCFVGIVLIVLSGGGVLFVVLVGIGFVIVIVDVVCFIYYYKYYLFMVYDSIGNVVFYIVNCFVN